MNGFHLASPGLCAALAALTLSALVAGCASSQPNSLAEHQARIEHQLISRCYQHHEGARAVLGALPVHVACRRWAERQVEVSISQQPGALLD